MVAGPREQFRPTTSAPAASSRRPASAIAALAHPTLPGDGEGDHGRLARALDRLERQEGLAAPAVGLADDEVDARVHRPVDLLVERPALAATWRRRPRRCSCCRCCPRAGRRLARDLLREAERRAVDPLEVALPDDHPHLGAMGVVGERLDHVRARVHEIPVELAHRFGCSRTTSGTKAPAWR